jgi:toxin-antitoxin system PIN domain toxin
MILPDANLILYAHNEADPEHKAALRWWKGLLQGPEEVGIPWVVVLSFLRLSTSNRVLLRPLTPQQSCDCLERWFRPSHVRAITPGSTHLADLLREVRQSGVGGNLTTDAHLVALAHEYRAVIHTADVDFSRFTGLRWKNPLKERSISASD